MNDLFAKCGNNCGLCPSYKENMKTDEDRLRCSEGWYKYHGFRLRPEKLRLCDGCQAGDDENPVRYITCYVRNCAVKNGVKTCAHCSGYPCEDVGRVSVSTDMREKTAARLGAPIPEEDYLMFIEPYEGMKHLDEIHSSLTPEDIVKMKRVSAKPTISEFPDLPFSTEEISALKTIYHLLAAVESAESVSYARKTKLQKRRRQLLRMLWIFGLYGEFNEEGSYLEIDGKTYLGQKMHSSYSVLRDYIETLEKFGVQCEFIQLKEKGWLTPTGALRKEGWLMTLSFDTSRGGTPALRALKKYTSSLDKEYGKNAFRYFSRADMRVFVKTENR